MSEANRIRKYYIDAPIKFIDSKWAKEDGRHKYDEFEINTKIWVDAHLPEYRVAIPSRLTMDGNFRQLLHQPIEMKFITYVPTGRVVYDNTGFSPNPIVYEYILESLLGKKDLKHR